MESSDDTQETLRKMAQFSISTNKINEIQQKNLKMYPFVYFNGVKSVKIDYDLTNHSKVDYDTDPKTFEVKYKFNKPKTDNFRISYELEIDESQNNSHLDRRFEALEKSISTLLWNGIPIEVSFNGRKFTQVEKMSENSITAKPVTDLSQSDMERITKFVNEGMPGLYKLDEPTLYRATEMYLSGSTYQQIQTALNLSRSLVLYVSHTYEWYAAKRDYLNEMQEKIKSRVIDSKLVSQDFLLLLIQAYQKKITKNLQRYLATDDESHTEEIDLKEIAQLLKTIEMVKDLGDDGKNSKGKAPAVGLNLGDGVTIERSGDKVTITPKERVLGDMLAKYADRRRAEEISKNSAKSSDIKKDVNKNEE